MTKRYRVWHVPQVPMEAFRVEVNTLQEAVLLANTLANYDLFQYENKVKPDYANASGIEQSCINENGEPDWEEFYDDETGIDDPEEYLNSLVPKETTHIASLNTNFLNDVANLDVYEVVLLEEYDDNIDNTEAAIRVHADSHEEACEDFMAEHWCNLSYPDWINLMVRKEGEESFKPYYVSVDQTVEFNVTEGTRK